MGLSGQISKELERAKQSGRFLVMISYVEKETDLVKHRTFTEDFPVREFQNCISEHSRHLKEQAQKAGKGKSDGTPGSEADPEGIA